MENYGNLKIIHIVSCKKCGRLMKDEWNFCPQCKEKAEVESCKHCSKEIKANWRFCPFCKTEVKEGRKQGLVSQYANQWLKELLQQ